MKKFLPRQRLLFAATLVVLAGLPLLWMHQPSVHAAAAASGSGQAASATPTPAQAGSAIFQQNCAFCHGRDAMGGETGPDLTRSELVAKDKDGTKIAEVIHNGRLTTEKKMPPFPLPDQQIAELIAFIRERVTIANSMKGGRRGVDVADLQTGNVEAGKQYFNGAGGCAKCHSPTGDLAGIATRYKGLHLEERMLYPQGVKSKVIVTLPSGQTIPGILEYQDEFTIGLRDADNTYRSWATKNVKFKVDAPVEAHVEQFPKYTDADIHNLMAYLQTLR
jgi:cytochrome c oxidase cbb3-type subunit III